MISLTDYLRQAGSELILKGESSRQGRVHFTEVLRNTEQVFTAFYGTSYKGYCAEIIAALEDEEIATMICMSKYNRNITEQVLRRRTL